MAQANINRYVFLAADENPDYADLMRMTAVFYERIGWTPIAFPVLKYWARPYRSASAAQCCRLYCACFPFADNDWVLTGDADMIPIDRKYFRQGEARNAVAFYANFWDGQRVNMTFKARAKTWRELMGITPSNTLHGMTQAVLQQARELGLDRQQEWGLDETVLSQRLAESRIPVERLHRNEVRRGQAAQRIDRVDWNLDQPNGVIDIHCMRQPFSDENWPKLLAAIEVAAPDMVSWTREYGESLRASRDGIQESPIYEGQVLA